MVQLNVLNLAERRELSVVRPNPFDPNWHVAIGLVEFKFELLVQLADGEPFSVQVNHEDYERHQLWQKVLPRTISIIEHKVEVPHCNECQYCPAHEFAGKMVSDLSSAEKGWSSFCSKGHVVRLNWLSWEPEDDGKVYLYRSSKMFTSGEEPQLGEPNNSESDSLGIHAVSYHGGHEHMCQDRLVTSQDFNEPVQIEGGQDQG